MPKHPQIQVILPEGKYIYFASDLHLGSPDYPKSKKREALFVQWLDEIKKDAAAIFLVGDVFDFWFEYRKVVPKGFIRLLGKLAEISDSGIPLYLFTGNHDLWMGDYFEQELGAKIFNEPVLLNCHNKLFFIGHGDGKGPGDFKFKVIKKVFTNPVCRWFFSWLHPDIGIKIAQIWSRASHTKPETELYKGDANEFLIQYVLRKSKDIKADYFVFGHRHFPMQKKLNESIYTNLGEWMYNKTYAVFDGNELVLKKYEKA